MIYFLHNEKQFIHHPAKMKKMIPKMGKKIIPLWYYIHFMERY